MSRYQDDDEYRLNGLERAGYDADTQTYTWRSTSGQLFQGSEGNYFGSVAPIGQTPAEDRMTVIGRDSDKQYLYPFFGLVFVFMVLIIFQPWTHWTARHIDCGLNATPRTIREGDTCYSIAQAAGISINDILKANKGLDCAKLSIGSTICVAAL